MKQLPFLNDAADAPTGSDASTQTVVLTRRTATPAVVNPQRPAVIVPVQSTSPEEIERQSRQAAATGSVDVIEWRIDQVIASRSYGGSGHADEHALAEVVLDLIGNVTSAGLPVLVTLRTGFEGGTAQVGEEASGPILADVIEGMSAAGHGVPIALDVEIDRSRAGELIERAHEKGIAVVASHHNFAATDSLESLGAKFAEMAKAGADVVKIAMMPQSQSDVADLLRAASSADAGLDQPVIGISMGRLGRSSRIMGGDFGSCASFAQLGEASAPGQIAVATLAGMFDRLYD